MQRISYQPPATPGQHQATFGVSDGHSTTILNLLLTVEPGRDDTLTGIAAADVLSGAAGHDVIHGLGSADRLNGGAGQRPAVWRRRQRPACRRHRCRCAGRRPWHRHRRLSHQRDAHHPVAGRGGSQRRRGGGGRAGIGRRCERHRGGDCITGDAARNDLRGGRGNDWLDGGAGRDTLSGGGGADTFVFATAPGADGPDRITDFTSGVDQILLSREAFGGLDTAIADGQLVLGTMAVDADDRLILDAATGRLFQDPDGTGALAQVLIGQFQPGVAITAGDVVLIG